jgi:flagellar hook-length control protein FliK
VNTTPPISAAGTAQGPLHAPSANSSLADLLFADSPANATSDFRTIAATLFGMKSSSTTPTQSLAKDTTTGKKPAAGLPQDEPKTGKNKEISEPTSAPAHPELTVPVLTVPLPLLQVPSEPRAIDGTVDLRPLGPHIDVDLTPLNSTALPGPAQIKNDGTATRLGGAEAANNPGVVSGSPEDGAPLIQSPPKEDGLKHKKEAAVSVASPPEIGTAQKKDFETAKPAADRFQAPGVPQPAKQPSTQASNINQPILPTDSNVVGSQDKRLPAVATDAVPPAPTVEPTSVVSAKEILDSSIATKTVLPSGSVNPGVEAGSKSASVRTAVNGSPKIKGRDNKDTRITPAQGGKPGCAQPGETVDGPANSVTGNSRDSASLALSAHSGVHAKPVPVKQSSAASSTPAALAESDGPDESLPTDAASPIATAKLVQGMSQSEFRVGMQSQEFGNIDIRTSVARHMFSAQISVEHGDMARSLTAELPGLYHRLADQQVPVGNIVIQGQSLGTSSGLAQDAQRQSWQPQRQSAAQSPTELVLPAMTEGFDSAGRLDIRI